MELNILLNDMQDDITVSNLAVSNIDNMEIAINVPLTGTLGTARFEKIQFDISENFNNERFV